MSATTRTAYYLEFWIDTAHASVVMRFHTAKDRNEFARHIRATIARCDVRKFNVDAPLSPEGVKAASDRERKEIAREESRQRAIAEELRMTFAVGRLAAGGLSE